MGQAEGWIVCENVVRVRRQIARRHVRGRGDGHFMDGFWSNLGWIDEWVKVKNGQFMADQ